MAYALCAAIGMIMAMNSVLTPLPEQIDTIAELRALYRAAEARAARMRLLSAAGRDLSTADPGTVDAVLQKCGERLAFFVGHRGATVTRGHQHSGIAIVAPGPLPRLVGSIIISDLPEIDAIADKEDRDSVRLCLEMMGSTIDRIDREEERNRLLAVLGEREQRLASLVGWIFSAQEEERRRVSQELHDGVAQTATALARMLEGPTDSAAAIPAEERARLAGIARNLVRELRAVIGGLRPTLLDDLGLEAALQSLAEGLQADGFAVTLRLDNGAARLPGHVETAIFRVAQEAVSNIRKHAGGPCAVAIELNLGADGTGRALRICDTGRGPRNADLDADDARPGAHVGIDVMRERMAAIGGRLEWRPGTHGGVTVIAHLGDTPGT